MPFTTQGRNDLLNNGLTAFTHVSALTDLGTTEIPGSTRQAVTWSAAAAGVRDNTAQLVIPISAGTTVTATAVYSALTVGNLLLWAQVGSTTRGVASVDTTANDIFQSDGHGLSNDHRVFVQSVAGESLPTGLSAATLYFVIASTTDTFQLSATSGGASAAITGLNEFAWFRTVPEVFSSAGNLTIAAGAFDIDLNFV